MGGQRRGIPRVACALGVPGNPSVAWPGLEGAASGRGGEGCTPGPGADAKNSNVPFGLAYFVILSHLGIDITDFRDTIPWGDDKQRERAMADSLTGNFRVRAIRPAFTDVHRLFNRTRDKIEVRRHS